MKSWYKSGAPWVWLNACAISVSILMVIGLLALITIRGLGHFWPADLADFDYTERDGSTSHIIGEFKEVEKISTEQLRATGDLNTGTNPWVIRHLIKVGNRDVGGMDFRWVIESRLSSLSYPENLLAIERREWGNLYGTLVSVQETGHIVAQGDAAWPAFQQRLARTQQLHKQIRAIEKGEIGSINAAVERLRLDKRKLELTGDNDPAKQTVILEKQTELQSRYDAQQKQLVQLYNEINRDLIVVMVAGGGTVETPLAKIVRVYRPNAMSGPEKLGHYFKKIWEFVSDEPREANTEGGIFPAIFGTVMMVMLMSVFVTPFGVLAAIYLREYARQGWLTRTIRIAVNNLAGVPSIVYGIFGLGFFVYFLGGNIDQLFFPEALPAPTMGTPGILWASLTLALLTVPVVIVATEEGLSRVPRAVREGSLALGATKAETLWHTVLPMASPAIMTGLILAIARAAGEVAPLMLVGVVKLAPSLPLDGNFPFLHLDRKFMHLGFHIYDVGFQSPNVEAARPLVYATALLLVIVIVVLNLAAIAIRNRLREKYKSLEQ